MIETFLKRLLFLFTRWHLLLGRNPRQAPPFSIIFFPAEESLLCCGIAGVLAVKGGSGPPAVDAGLNLARCFAEIRKVPLSKVIAGKARPEGYLAGEGPLAEMEQDLVLLRQEPPFQALFFDPARAEALQSLVPGMSAFLAEEEGLLEAEAGRFATAQMEIITSRLILFKDIIWGLEHDILANIGKILHLAGAGGVGELTPESFVKYARVNFLLNCIDRLEVRGRDSAGLQVSLALEDRDTMGRIVEELRGKGLQDEFARRSVERDLMNGSILVADHRHGDGGVWLAFVYKTASIIGKLGENVRKLREAIRADRIFHTFAREAALSESTFAHTRWASVGSITEENCHPISSYTLCDPDGQIPPPGLCAIPAPIAETFADELVPGMKYYPAYGPGRWTVSVALNGDIDNYQMLRSLLESAYRYEIAPEVTSDTKIIPLQVERYLLAGKTLKEAFRLAVNDFEGSHAIAMTCNVEPGKIYLALKGSGQALFVGLREDQYLFASELYGLVEGTSRFIKMDGERPRDPDNSDSSGQIFVLDQHSEGGLAGIRALYYDGHPVGLTESMIQTAEITTRDIDRGAFPHFFLKEITESAQSVRKTLRGKYRIEEEKKSGRRKVHFNLGRDILPETFVASLKAKRIRHIYVIGQGTAAVAGQAIADGLALYLKGAPVHILGKKASEMSGFLLGEDLSDTLVVAVTQSGTTTDTNRAVAMAGERGATILSIVNRRQSDITTKSHGVFYTSDGRDIEMSVASTKAFYSQIVAGYVLALAFAQILRTHSDEFIAAELTTLEKAPALMQQVLGKKDEIRRSAEGIARLKKYWAVVGSGPNKASADEIRIKLSELCYKTISSDFIEDKKHIDLSSEPLILVCAAGNPETVAGDVVKDTAIFKAHKAAVVVFAEEGETRFDRIADSVIRVPRAPMPLPVILNTLAGHLWGYYAASAIDDDAAFFREFRNEMSLAVVEQDHKNYTLYQRILDRNLHRVLKDFAEQFTERKNRGVLTLMNARTMTDLSLLTKYVAGKLPLEDFWGDFGETDDVSPIDLLNIAFGHAIDELSRPIDAIRHQAKTVTVGTSRKEEMLRGVLFDLLASLKCTPKNLKAENILALDRIQKAVAGVRGYTLYEIVNLDAEGYPTDDTTISIVNRGGVSVGMVSRAETSKAIMGTKRTIARTGNLYVGLGRVDSRPLVIIPLLKGGEGVSGLLLVHVDFNPALTVADKVEILGDRYRDILNLVNEYNLPWDDAYLGELPIEILLGESVEFIAAKIRKTLDAKKEGSPA